MHPLVASVHSSPQRPILIRIEATFTRMSPYSLNTGMKAMITGAEGLRTGLNGHSYGLSGDAVEHAYCCARYLVNVSRKSLAACKPNNVTEPPIPKCQMA